MKNLLTSSSPVAAIMSEEHTTQNHKLEQLGSLVNEHIARNIGLANALTAFVANVTQIVNRIDASKLKTLARSDNAVINARQLLYKFEKTQPLALLAPDHDDDPTWAIQWAHRFLLDLPIKSGHKGFDEKVAAITAVRKLVEVLHAGE